MFRCEFCFLFVKKKNSFFENRFSFFVFRSCTNTNASLYIGGKMIASTSPCLLSRWRPPRPPRQQQRIAESRDDRRMRRSSTSANSADDVRSPSSPSTPSSDDAALFDSLASAFALAAPAAVTSGISPVTGARGLVTVKNVRPGERLLAVDRATALVVADDGVEASDPSSSGCCFASQALDEFQMLHGAFPRELEKFLRSGAVGWFPRLCAFLLWATVAEQGPGRRGSSGGGGGGGGSLSSLPPFAAYSRLLPDPERDLGLLLSFDEREAGLLLPRELAAVAERERESLKRAVHDRWFGTCSSSSSSSSAFSLASLGLTPRGFESTLAAAALVNSRCFAEEAPGGGGGGGPRRQALSLVVPLCDFANHSSAPSAAFRLSTEEEGAFELVATRSILPGEEVTISYVGGAGNASSFGGSFGGSSSAAAAAAASSSKDSTGMLRAYGFVVPGNPADRLASLAEAGRSLEQEASRRASSSSSSSASPSALLLLLPAASAALASRSRDAAERRRIAAAAASIAEGAAGGASAGSVLVSGGAREPSSSSSSSSSSSHPSSFSGVGGGLASLLAARAEAEAEGAREAAGRAARLASKGDVSPARAEAASSWWLERAELARCGAELLRELASGGA